jgi:hypothetical protein
MTLLREAWMIDLVLALALTGGTAPAGPAPVNRERPIASAKDPDKIICKTRAPVGSLIANDKECRSRREWDRMHVDTMHPLQGGSCNSAETGNCN